MNSDPTQTNQDFTDQSGVSWMTKCCSYVNASRFHRDLYRCKIHSTLPSLTFKLSLPIYVNNWKRAENCFGPSRKFHFLVCPFCATFILLFTHPNSGVCFVLFSSINCTQNRSIFFPSVFARSDSNKQNFSCDMKMVCSLPLQTRVHCATLAEWQFTLPACSIETEIDNSHRGHFHSKNYKMSKRNIWSCSKHLQSMVQKNRKVDCHCAKMHRRAKASGIYLPMPWDADEKLIMLWQINPMHLFDETRLVTASECHPNRQGKISISKLNVQTVVTASLENRTSTTKRSILRTNLKQISTQIPLQCTRVIAHQSGQVAFSDVTHTCTLTQNNAFCFYSFSKEQVNHQIHFCYAYRSYVQSSYKNWYSSGSGD